MAACWEHREMLPKPFYNADSIAEGLESAGMGRYRAALAHREWNTACTPELGSVRCKLMDIAWAEFPNPVAVHQFRLPSPKCCRGGRA